MVLSGLRCAASLFLLKVKGLGLCRPSFGGFRLEFTGSGLGFGAALGVRPSNRRIDLGIGMIL